MSDEPFSDRSGELADDIVEAVLPLDTRYIATLRLLTASLAVDAGFSVDEIDDLRLAISEVWSAMADRAPEGRIAARFTPRTAGLAVTLTLLARGANVSPAEPLMLDELGRSILESVVDSYVISGCDVAITKRATEVSAS
jgi:serine/threonine-protein kinase RsbW